MIVWENVVTCTVSRTVITAVNTVWTPCIVFYRVYARASARTWVSSSMLRLCGKKEWDRTIVWTVLHLCRKHSLLTSSGTARVLFIHVCAREGDGEREKRDSRMLRLETPKQQTTRSFYPKHPCPCMPPLTLAPFFRRISVKALPSPCAPPVTSAARPSTFMFDVRTTTASPPTLAQKYTCPLHHNRRCRQPLRSYRCRQLRSPPLPPRDQK